MVRNIFPLRAGRAVLPSILAGALLCLVALSGCSAGDETHPAFVISEWRLYTNTSSDASPSWILTCTGSSEIDGLGAAAVSSVKWEDGFVPDGSPAATEQVNRIDDNGAIVGWVSAGADVEDSEIPITNEITYDESDRPVEIRTGSTTTTITYEEDGSRIESIARPDLSNSSILTFNPEGILLSEVYTDETGTVTVTGSSELDEEGRVVEVFYTVDDGRSEYELPGSTRFEYDSDGNIASMITVKGGIETSRTDYDYVAVDSPGSYVEYRGNSYSDTTFSGAMLDWFWD